MRNIFWRCIDIASILLHPVTRVLCRDRVRVLCYHKVSSIPQTNIYIQELAVPVDKFTAQMHFLARKGFNIITLDELISCRGENRNPPPRTVIITFDDGYRDNYENAFPILREHGFKADIFLVTRYIGGRDALPWLKLDEEMLKEYREWLPMGEAEIAEMDEYGISFGSHTATHCDLSKIDRAMAQEELVESKKALEEILSRPVTCFSYPYGALDSHVKEMVKAVGYRVAVSTKGGGNNLKADAYELRRTLIDGGDSLSRFVRKVEGAYDWVEYLFPVVGFLKRLAMKR